jgi:hypothetical protein
MADIYAKLNITGSIWDPTDPNNWKGGVTPGPLDTAHFYTFDINATYEDNSNYLYQNYLYDVNGYNRYNFTGAQDWQTRRPQYDNQSGYYSHSFWAMEYGNDHPTRNWSGSYQPDKPAVSGQSTWRYGSAMIYGSPGVWNAAHYGTGSNDETRAANYTHWGDYYAQNGYNYRGTRKSAYQSVLNYWNSTHSPPQVYYAERGPRYYQFAAYAIRVDGTGNTSITLDGVTISQDADVLYATQSRQFGVSKQDQHDKGCTYTMTDRMFDLFTGSALHIDNGGRWKAWGPHNNRYSSNYWYDFNNLNVFTVAMETGSNMSSVPSISDTNCTTYGSHGDLRARWHMGLFTGSIYDEKYPTRVFGNGLEDYPTEGTESMRYSNRFGNEVDFVTSSYNLANLNNPNGGWQYAAYYTGSKSSYLEGMLNAYSGWQGVGPGNLGRVRYHIPNGTRYYNNIHEIQIDPNFHEYVTQSRLDHPMFSDMNSYISSGTPLATGNEKVHGYMSQARLMRHNKIQHWALTGSQHWIVGRIEMGRYTHFHVKDESKITLYDMQSATNGTNANLSPTIDFEDNGTNATLVVTDSATLEISSSRTSYWDNDEHGIYLRRNATSLIISGAANYSCSNLAFAAPAGASTIEVTNLTGSFGVGDIVSIQSTGSYQLDSIGSNDFGINTLSGSLNPEDSGSWYSGSVDQLIKRSAAPANTSYYNTHQASTTHEADHPLTMKQSMNIPHGRKFTHAVHKDELVVIAATSSNNSTATIRKFYGKEGEIHQDQGLFSYGDYATTFNDVPENVYSGEKRVVLVDSNHRKFEIGEQFEISGSVYKILHATTFLSQSLFIDFSLDTNPPLDEMFDLNQHSFSGSSIWYIPSDADDTRASNIDSYIFEKCTGKHFMLITGSYQGTDEIIAKHGAVGIYSIGKSGSSNGYRALRLDPTLTTNWYNFRQDYMAHSSYDYRYRYQRHNNHTTRYMQTHFVLRNTDNFVEGEITVSGSLLRDGFMDPTSSIGYWSENAFGITWANTAFDDHKTIRWDSNAPYGYRGYNYPYPYSPGFSLSGRYMGQLTQTKNTYHTGITLTKHGEFFGSINSNPGYPYRYSNRQYGKSIEDDPGKGDWSIDGWANDFTASYYKITSSMEHKRETYPDKFGGSGKLRVEVNDNICRAFVDDGRGNELLFDTMYEDSGRGPIGLQIADYGSIHSVNVKERYQQLILDTTDAFDRRDKLYESRLLYDHHVNKDVNFIGTLVTDAKGFKNILWDYVTEKAETEVRPNTFAICNQSTSASGNISTNLNSTGYYNHSYYRNHSPLIPDPGVGNYYQSRYQSNDNYYVIYDMKVPVTFDTVGMIFAKDIYGHENVTNNQMNNVRFEVCDDVGVASPDWQIVRATANDERYSNYRGGIRFYTFASGSVTKRYIKYHSRGGTNSSAFAMHSHFGLYNFSGSCAASNTLDSNAVAGGFADIYGNPTASMNQIELANTKNFAVGDMIYFWSKQMNTTGIFYYEAYENPSYYNTTGVTGFSDRSTTEAQVIPGFWPVFTITNIQGNIVTLDKPISHTHIDKGTIAYKYNRGKVTVRGDRNLVFQIGFFYNNYVRRTLRNITGINAFVDNYSTTYWGMHSVEDVGMLTYRGQGGNQNAWYKPAGLYRNIYTQGFSVFGGVQRGDDFRSCKIYHIHNEYPGPGSAGPFGPLYRYHENVISFCRSGFSGGYETRIYDNYGQFGLQSRGQIYYQNNWSKGDRYAEIFPVANNPQFGVHQNSIINIGDICSLDNQETNGGLFGQSRVSTGYNAQSRAYADHDRDYNLVSRYTWWNPYSTNPKHKKTIYTTENTYHNFKVASTSNYHYYFGNPRLFGKHQQYYFNRKKFLFTGNVFYYGGTIITEGIDFKQDGMYDIFSIAQYQPDHTYSTGNSQIPMIWNSEFDILEDDTEIRLDIDMKYIIPRSTTLGYGPTYANGRLYNSFGNMFPAIVVEDVINQRSLLTVNLYETILTDLNMREIFNLPKGSYRVNLVFKNAYRMGFCSTIMSMKDLNFNIVTTDLNNVHVRHSNWDNMELLKVERQSESNYRSKNVLRSESTGKNAVVKQSSDLSGTKNVKFNKIKI